MERIIKKSSDYLYFIFRLVVSILFFFHGFNKLNLILAGKMSLFSLMGLAMILEIFVGFFVFLGLFTSYFALLGSFVMVGAWFVAHIPRGWNPFTNGGELALLFLVSFLGIASVGGGKFSLDNYLRRKK
ncbi:MAG: DoxX family protein [Candidatus Pacearchaeota archaeon]